MGWRGSGAELVLGEPRAEGRAELALGDPGGSG